MLQGRRIKTGCGIPAAKRSRTRKKGADWIITSGFGQESRLTPGITLQTSNQVIAADFLHPFFASSRLGKFGCFFSAECGVFPVRATALVFHRFQSDGYGRGEASMGSTRASRVVFGALAEDGLFRPFHAVFDGGVEKPHARARVLPRILNMLMRSRTGNRALRWRVWRATGKLPKVPFLS